jgi:hypothetical protein
MMMDAMGDALHKVMQLQAKSYKIKNDAEAAKYYNGFIAQEMEKIFPEFVTSLGDGGSNGIYTMDYGGLSVVALKAIQEQQLVIEELKAEMESLKREISNYKN